MLPGDVHDLDGFEWGDEGHDGDAYGDEGAAGDGDELDVLDSDGVNVVVGGAHLLGRFLGLGLYLCLPPSHPLPLMGRVLFVLAGAGCGTVEGHNRLNTV